MFDYLKYKLFYNDKVFNSIIRQKTGIKLITSDIKMRLNTSKECIIAHLYDKNGKQWGIEKIDVSSSCVYVHTTPSSSLAYLKNKNSNYSAVFSSMSDVLALNLIVRNNLLDIKNLNFANELLANYIVDYNTISNFNTVYVHPKKITNNTVCLLDTNDSLFNFFKLYPQYGKNAFSFYRL